MFWWVLLLAPCPAPTDQRNRVTTVSTRRMRDTHDQQTTSTSRPTSRPYLPGAQRRRRAGGRRGNYAGGGAHIAASPMRLGARNSREGPPGTQTAHGRQCPPRPGFEAAWAQSQLEVVRGGGGGIKGSREKRDADSPNGCPRCTPFRPAPTEALCCNGRPSAVRCLCPHTQCTYIHTYTVLPSCRRSIASFTH